MRGINLTVIRLYNHVPSGSSYLHMFAYVHESWFKYAPVGGPPDCGLEELLCIRNIFEGSNTITDAELNTNHQRGKISHLDAQPRETAFQDQGPN